MLYLLLIANLFESINVALVAYLIGIVEIISYFISFDLVIFINKSPEVERHKNLE